MKRLLVVTLVLAAADGSAQETPCAGEGGSGGAECAAESGDVNGDGTVDVSDAVTVLGNLFLGAPAQLPPLCGPSSRSGLPDTGQILCYDAAGAVVDCASETCPGQDGFHATGCPVEGRFLDRGDGTVTDACTGLMWQKRTADLNGDGVVTPNLSGADSPDAATWEGALRYCHDLEFAGYDDWRLPNARELDSIVDYGRDDPDPSVNPIFEASKSAYWTSTSRGLTGELASVVCFWSCDHLYHAPKEADRLVRAVRSGCSAQNGDANADGAIDLSDAVTILGHLFLGKPQRLLPLCAGSPRSGLPDTGQTLCYDAAGNVIDCASETCPGQDAFHATGCAVEGRFFDHGDGTVTDACTGLMWQKRTADLNGDGVVTPRAAGVDGPDQVAWQGALLYCEGLEFSGHDDWRLPSVRELESLVDYGRRDPSIDPVFETEPSNYWTSTTLVRAAGEPVLGPEHAWFVSFWQGSDVYHQPKAEARFVRAVRTAR